jgi:predicted CXXCH cytochrome family protein
MTAPRFVRSITRRVGAPGSAGVFVGALLLSIGCTDETIIEVERPFFPPADDAAVGYLGYDEAEVKLTVCGNCHVGQQAGWENTAHADAWEGLQSSGGAQAFCEGCHTVGPMGSAASAEGGWSTTQDPRYHDVQCENCHGPGQTHVSNPDASQPIPSLAVGTPETGLTTCAECHSGEHHPFVEEWSESPHAHVVEYPASRPEECGACHVAQVTLQTWGENADYLEKDGAPLPVVCAVCHDPHDATNEGQLRFPVNTTSIENHLCARCHNRRTVPDPNSSHGLEPHAPESALIVGEAGWFPPNSNIDQGQIIATHGSGANPRLCATCHLPMFQTEVGNATGHLFRPIPCIGADGKPLPFGQDCDLAPPSRYYGACTGGACHASENNAFAALTAATTRMQRWVDELEDLLLAVDPNLEDEGGAIDPANPTFTVAEGAFFNLAMAEHGSEEFGTNSIIGSTVHNPFLMEALLVGSIIAVEDEYGIAANRAVDWDAELARVLRNAKNAH